MANKKNNNNRPGGKHPNSPRYSERYGPGHVNPYLGGQSGQSQFIREMEDRQEAARVQFEQEQAVRRNAEQTAVSEPSEPVRQPEVNPRQRRQDAAQLAVQMQNARMETQRKWDEAARAAGNQAQNSRTNAGTARRRTRGGQNRSVNDPALKERLRQIQEQALMEARELVRLEGSDPEQMDSIKPTTDVRMRLSKDNRPLIAIETTDSDGTAKLKWVPVMLSDEEMETFFPARAGGQDKKENNKAAAAEEDKSAAEEKSQADIPEEQPTDETSAAEQPVQEKNSQESDESDEPVLIPLDGTDDTSQDGAAQSANVVEMLSDSDEDGQSDGGDTADEPRRMDIDDVPVIPVEASDGEEEESDDSETSAQTDDEEDQTAESDEDAEDEVPDESSEDEQEEPAEDADEPETDDGTGDDETDADETEESLADNADETVDTEEDLPDNDEADDAADEPENRSSEEDADADEESGEDFEESEEEPEAGDDDAEESDEEEDIPFVSDDDADDESYDEDTDEELYVEEDLTYDDETYDEESSADEGRDRTVAARPAFEELESSGRYAQSRYSDEDEGQDDTLFLRREKPETAALFVLPKGMSLPKYIDDDDFVEHWLGEEEEDMATVRKRRRRRIAAFIGAATMVLALIGFIAVAKWGLGLLGNIGSSESQKEIYAEYISPVVMSEVPVFEAWDAIPQEKLLQSAVFSVLLDTEVTYERDDVGNFIIPSTDIVNEVKELYGAYGDDAAQEEEINDKIRSTLYGSVSEDADNADVYYVDMEDSFHVADALSGPAPQVTQISKRDNTITLDVEYHEDLETGTGAILYSRKFILALTEEGKYIQAIRELEETK